MSDYLAKYRAKIDAERKRKEAKDGLWKPQPGRYFGRILPPWPGSEEWYLSYRCHYQILPNVGEDEPTWLICLKTFKKPCYACEVVNSMWEEFRAGNSVDEVLKKRASNIGGKDRYMVNFIKTTEPTNVMRWDFGGKVHDQLNGITAPITEEDTDTIVVPVWDAERGYVLTIIVKAVKEGQRSWNETLVQLPPGSQPKKLPNMDVLGKLFNLADWLKKNTKAYDEMRALLSGETEEAPPAEGTPETDAPAETPEEPTIPEETPPEEVHEAEASEPAETPPPPPKTVAKPVGVPVKTGVPVVRPSGQDATAAARLAMKNRFSVPKK